MLAIQYNSKIFHFLSTPALGLLMYKFNIIFRWNSLLVNISNEDRPN